MIDGNPQLDEAIEYHRSKMSELEGRDTARAIKHRNLLHWLTELRTLRARVPARGSVLPVSPTKTPRGDVT
jgi:hypothetical protein